MKSICPNFGRADDRSNYPRLVMIESEGGSRRTQQQHCLYLIGNKDLEAQQVLSLLFANCSSRCGDWTNIGAIDRSSF